MREDFIKHYLDYTADTEPPVVFHRWACLAVLGAWLGRNYSFKFGHTDINPNLYTMLMGAAGTRKTTAIKMATKIIKLAGYTNIAADKSTKEKFLLDLAGEDDEDSKEDILEKNLFGPGTEAGAAEILVAADEFNSFVGNGNIEFLSLLGVLWDYDGVFKNRVKNSKSIEINNPTVSILAGNTPTGFTLAFPVESIGQGIFSRILLIHGEPSGRKITFPKAPDPKHTETIVTILHHIRNISRGYSTLSPIAELLLDKIYKTWRGIEDVRFESYSNRRFTQLIKLCLIVSASRLGHTIEEDDVIYANTILTHTEHSMPQSLGAFGKAKNSDVAHKILQIINSSPEPLQIFDIWKHVNNDLNDPRDLGDLLRNLSTAEKIQSVKTDKGSAYIPKKKVIEEVSDGLVDFGLLTEEERKYVI